MQDLTNREQDFLLEMSNKALQIPKMELKEVVDELRSIRVAYEDNNISMAVANKAGLPFVDRYNKLANARARAYGITGSKSISKNVKFYPMPLFK